MNRFGRLLRRGPFDDPHKLLDGLVLEGMTVFEPACGQGDFTLPLARMVGASGKVIAVDAEPDRVAAAGRRVMKSRLMDRMTFRLADAGRLGTGDLAGRVDLVVDARPVDVAAPHERQCSELWALLKSGGALAMIAPKRHDARVYFADCLSLARAAGFRLDPQAPANRATVVMRKCDG
jgi:ubiquinone/menaquinone biosynthesis C-methylase UbiE